MRKLIHIKCDPMSSSDTYKQLIRGIQSGNWVGLFHQVDNNKEAYIPSYLLPEGPGVVIASSGSTGGRHYCLQPCTHLDQSAFATGEWLKAEGIDPKQCRIYNPLPMNHVSGLMPWWRSRYWGAEYEWVSSSLIRNPYLLAKSEKINLRNNKHSILSLVPTQLKRLLQNPNGIRWLKSFTVIWIGGSPLPRNLAEISRDNGIRLSPCYGSTETMAMVTALSPKDFLQGETGVGRSLVDIELRVSQTNKGLQIRTSRLAIAIWVNGHLKTIKDKHGWWSSGDSAKIIKKKNKTTLTIKGRIDNAIHSGGETIFPDVLQEQLLKLAKNNQLPIDLILLAPIKDEEWGARIIALVRLDKKNYSQENTEEIFQQLKELVKTWVPSEIPRSWYNCHVLESNSLGKWNLDKWISWAKENDPIL